MKKSPYLFLILFFSCTQRPTSNQDVNLQKNSLCENVSNVHVNESIDYETDTVDLDDESKIATRVDSWYQNVPSLLEKLEKLITQKKYKQAASIYESDSVQVIESLFDRWGDSMFFPEFSGLSEESSVKFRNNASEERIKLLQLKIDLYEKTMQNEKDSSFIRNYIFSLDQLAKYYYFDKNLEKASRVMNKAVNFVCEKEGEKSLPYATIIFNQAMLYKEMGDEATALKKFQKSKEIYEHIGMKDSEEWQNCVDLIQEIKQ